MPGALLVGPAALELSALIRRHNNVSSEAAQLRLRMAVHTGLVEKDQYGTVGSALNHLFRLLDASVFKEALSGSKAEVGLIVSNRFYDDVVLAGMSMLDPAGFRPVLLEVKGTAARGWMYPLDARPRHGSADVPQGHHVAGPVTPTADETAGLRATGGRDRLGAHLVSALEALEGPWEGPGAVGRSGHLTVTATRDSAAVQVKAEPTPPAGLPLALVEQSGLTHLARLDESGLASFTLQTAQDALLTVPRSLAVAARPGAAEIEALQMPTTGRFVAADTRRGPGRRSGCPATGPSR